MRKGLSVERERDPSSEESMGAAMCQARAGHTKTRRWACKEESQVHNKCYARGSLGCCESLERGQVT